MLFIHIFSLSYRWTNLLITSSYKVAISMLRKVSMASWSSITLETNENHSAPSLYSEWSTTSHWNCTRSSSNAIVHCHDPKLSKTAGPFFCFEGLSLTNVMFDNTHLHWLCSPWLHIIHKQHTFLITKNNSQDLPVVECLLKLFVLVWEVCVIPLFRLDCHSKSKFQLLLMA